VGGPSNTCEAGDRAEGPVGQDPCPELERQGGIWRFDAGRTGQTQADGERYPAGQLFGVQHGRDQLHQNWPALFSEEQGAHKPSEELVQIERGDDFGWPFCYHDPETDRLVLSPEYGGDGERSDRCSEKKGPAFAFPAHWAPEAILFYTADQFPARYRNGAFISFHGSWNRAPLPQGGYNVVFLPFENGSPMASPAPMSVREAPCTVRPGWPWGPTGRSTSPTTRVATSDGSLYIADDKGGRIWRVIYVGE
jgi:glucose/arabinose dehydrogenase